MAKHYEQYCPMAHALDLVGERWALLVVRELMHGPKRYTDLAERLPGIGTNILASRLRDLEAGGVVARRTLPPPAASRVYELTEYGRALRPALRELALWGARSLGPPSDKDELFDGWLSNAVDTVLAPFAPPGRFEFRVGDEIASLVDGEALAEPIESPDVVVEADPEGIYYLFVERRLDRVKVEGDRTLLERLIDAAPPVDFALSGLDERHPAEPERQLHPRRYARPRSLEDRDPVDSASS
jgi:DNA-binding HxlR family transcriptional regulator